MGCKSSIPADVHQSGPLPNMRRAPQPSAAAAATPSTPSTPQEAAALADAETIRGLEDQVAVLKRQLAEKHLRLEDERRRRHELVLSDGEVLRAEILLLRGQMDELERGKLELESRWRAGQLEVELYRSNIETQSSEMNALMAANQRVQHDLEESRNRGLSLAEDLRHLTTQLSETRKLLLDSGVQLSPRLKSPRALARRGTVPVSLTMLSPKGRPSKAPRSPDNTSDDSSSNGGHGSPEHSQQQQQQQVQQRRQRRKPLIPRSYYSLDSKLTKRVAVATAAAAAGTVTPTATVTVTATTAAATTTTTTTTATATTTTPSKSSSIESRMADLEKVVDDMGERGHRLMTRYDSVERQRASLEDEPDFDDVARIMHQQSDVSKGSADLQYELHTVAATTAAATTTAAAAGARAVSLSPQSPGGAVFLTVPSASDNSGGSANTTHDLLSLNTTATTDDGLLEASATIVAAARDNSNAPRKKPTVSELSFVTDDMDSFTDTHATPGADEDDEYTVRDVRSLLLRSPELDREQMRSPDGVAVTGAAAVVARKRETKPTVSELSFVTSDGEDEEDDDDDVDGVAIAEDGGVPPFQDFARVNSSSSSADVQQHQQQQQQQHQEQDQHQHQQHQEQQQEEQEEEHIVLESGEVELDDDLATMDDERSGRLDDRIEFVTPMHSSDDAPIVVVPTSVAGARHSLLTIDDALELEEGPPSPPPTRAADNNNDDADADADADAMGTEMVVNDEMLPEEGPLSPPPTRCAAADDDVDDGDDGDVADDGAPVVLATASSAGSNNRLADLEEAFAELERERAELSPALKKRPSASKVNDVATETETETAPGTAKMGGDWTDELQEYLSDSEDDMAPAHQQQQQLHVSSPAGSGGSGGGGGSDASPSRARVAQALREVSRLKSSLKRLDLGSVAPMPASEQTAAPATSEAGGADVNESDLEDINSYLMDDAVTPAAHIPKLEFNGTTNKRAASLPLSKSSSSTRSSRSKPKPRSRIPQPLSSDGRRTTTTATTTAAATTSTTPKTALGGGSRIPNSARRHIDAVDLAATLAPLQPPLSPPPSTSSATAASAAAAAAAAAAAMMSPTSDANVDEKKEFTAGSPRSMFALDSPERSPSSSLSSAQARQLVAQVRAMMDKTTGPHRAPVVAINSPTPSQSNLYESSDTVDFYALPLPRERPRERQRAHTITTVNRTRPSAPIVTRDAALAAASGEVAVGTMQPQSPIVGGDDDDGDNHHHHHHHNHQQHQQPRSGKNRVAKASPTGIPMYRRAQSEDQPSTTMQRRQRAATLIPSTTKPGRGHQRMASRQEYQDGYSVQHDVNNLHARLQALPKLSKEAVSNN